MEPVLRRKSNRALRSNLLQPIFMVQSAVYGLCSYSTLRWQLVASDSFDLAIAPSVLEFLVPDLHVGSLDCNGQPTSARFSADAFRSAG